MPGAPLEGLDLRPADVVLARNVALVEVGERAEVGAPVQGCLCVDPGRVDAVGDRREAVGERCGVVIPSEAAERLRVEAERYEAVPHYASHFQRMGLSALDTCISGATPEDLQRGLTSWDGVVDEVVCRLITTGDSVDEVARVIEATRSGA